MDESGALRPSILIPAGTPIEIDLPIDERVRVRVDTVLPINTHVVVPLRSPLGNYDVPIPIRADVPLRADLPIDFRHTVRIRTRTTGEIVLPLEIRGPP
jgi:hypothetical protein